MVTVNNTDTIGEIKLLRSTGKILGNLCHACKMVRTIKDADFGLVIDMDSLNVVLCSYHEGELIERLLTNYLKRISRKNTVGFVGPIPKPSKENEEKKNV